MSSHLKLEVPCVQRHSLGHDELLGAVHVDLWHVANGGRRHLVQRSLVAFVLRSEFHEKSRTTEKTRNTIIRKIFGKKTLTETATMGRALLLRSSKARHRFYHGRRFHTLATLPHHII